MEQVGVNDVYKVESNGGSSMKSVKISWFTF